VRLVALKVRRMPGIDDPFELGGDQLGAGLHVVHGPNGVGKSTLCRAAHALLWPGTLSTGAVSVEATFEDAGRVWFARREGRNVDWQRDGAPSGPPDLPEEHLARCFLITIDDLYDSDRDGGWFAARVLQEMAGGYDVGGVRRELFERGSRHGHGERKALDEARALVRRRELEQERVLEEESDLAGLERDLELARAAAAELGALEAAAELVGVRAQLAGRLAVLEDLPAATARMSGAEPDQLTQLEGDLLKLREKRRELERQVAAAREQAAAARLPRELPPSLLDEQRERLDEQKERERELREVHADLEAARSNIDALAARLGPEADVERLLAGAEVDLEGVQRLALDAQALALERAGLTTGLQGLGPDPAGGQDSDTLLAGAQALRAWLRTPGPSAQRRSPWGPVSVALSAAIALVLGLLLHPAALALLVAPVLIALALLRERPRSDARVAFQEQYARTRLAQPAAWEAAAVEQRLEELGDERDRALEQERTSERRRELELRMAALAEAEQALEERRAELRSAVGVEAPASDVAFAEFLARLAELRRASTQRHAAEGRRVALERERAGLHQALAAFVREQGEEPGADATALDRALRSIGQRNQALRDARADLARLEAELRERTEVQETLQASRRELFERLDLAEDDLAGLEQLGRQRAQRLEAERAVSEVRGQVRALEARLQGAPQVAALEPGEVAGRLERSRAEAERVVELERSIAGIERGLRDARARSDLEEARAAEELARARMEEARDDALRAAAGRMLLAELEREHERLSRPAVLVRADALFAGFTDHRHGIDVAEGPDGPLLRATDSTRPGVGLDPEELSSGTRAQLLLAVRLAFAAQAERGPRLPLFVDDALATSDPDRVRAIARSLVAIARDEARQVIVLTKDEGDVGLIASVADGATLRVTDLAALRRTAAAQTRRERLQLPAARRVPAPEGGDGPAYAQALGVPPLDPWRPLEEAHLYHLLPDDLALLHRLLSLGVERLGPLAQLLAAGTSLSLDAATRRRLETTLELARATYAGWRIGRGTPLTREALRDCPAISETFEQRVAELAAELGWQAKALVQALADQRVERFRGSKAAEAAEWFEQLGYIAPDEPLTRDAAWARLLRALDGIQPALRPDPEHLRRRFDYLWRRFEEGGA
jgi:hypothetical protein